MVIKRLVPVFVILCIVSVSILLYFLLLDKPSLLEALPQYPTSSEVYADKPLSTTFHYELLNYSCGETVVGENYRVFTTNDTAISILDFYRDVTRKTLSNKVRELEGRDFSDISSGYSLNDPLRIKILCFIANRQAGKSAANVVIIFEPENVEKYENILEVFQGIPSNQRVIMLLQGFIYHI